LIANYAGATTIALTRTSTKKQQHLDAGAAHFIATEEVDLVGEVMRITNGQSARVAFDPVGGPGFPKLISALAFGGIIYIYGLLGTAAPWALCSWSSIGRASGPKSMAVAMAAGAVVFHVDIFIRQRCLDLVGKCTIALIERWWPQTLPAFEHCLLERQISQKIGDGAD
jgi:NADPH:quinone reductase-like Zn-dependent oxidoreductase